MAISKTANIPNEEMEEDLQAEVMSVMDEDSSSFDPDLVDAMTAEEELGEAGPEEGQEAPEQAETEPAAEAVPEQQTEPTREEAAAEQAAQSDLLQSNYTNPIAKILDMLAKVFGNNTMIGNLLTSVAAKMEKTTNPVSQELAASEQKSDAGAEAKAAVMGFTMTQNSPAVMEALVGSVESENAQLTQITELAAVGAKEDPMATADVMLQFDQECKIHIDRCHPGEDASPEDIAAYETNRENAMTGLGKANASMVTDFYHARMMAERSGEPLSDEMREKMNAFTHMEGIQVDYDHWYPGVDVTVAQTEEEAIAAAEKHAQGAAYAGSNENVFENGTAVHDVAGLAAVGDNAANHNAMVASVKSLAAEDPIKTADAIKEYRTTCLEGINNYQSSSMSGDDLVMTKNKALNGFYHSQEAMVEGYYGYAMECERSGQPLPEGVQERLDEFRQWDGIEVDYAHWYPGCDVRVPLGADAADAAALKHEAALKYDGDFQNDSMDAMAKAHPEVMQDWNEQAYIDFAEDNYQDIAESPTMVAQSVKTVRQNLRENLEEDTEDLEASPVRNERLAEDYMTMGAGIQTYYDTSKRLIEQSGLPEDQKALKQSELEVAMRSQVTEFYEAASSDDRSLGQPVFTDGQKELIQFNIPGVNVSFKDYQPGMDIASGEMPSQEIEPMKEMSVEEMASLDQKNPSDLDMEGFGYVVSSHETQARSNESVFADTPSQQSQVQTPARTGEAQRKTVVPEAARETQVETPAAKPADGKKPGVDRGALAAEILGTDNIEKNAGKGHGLEY